MAEYIEREAAIKEFSNNGSIFMYGEKQCKAIVSRLNVIPAADVRPVVRGKWKLATYSQKYGNAKEKWYDQFLDGAFLYCDHCGERAKRSNFCPNCGADMMEES